MATIAVGREDSTDTGFRDEDRGTGRPIVALAAACAVVSTRNEFVGS